MEGNPTLRPQVPTCTSLKTTEEWWALRDRWPGVGTAGPKMGRASTLKLDWESDIFSGGSYDE